MCECADIHLNHDVCGGTRIITCDYFAHRCLSASAARQAGNDDRKDAAKEPTRPNLSFVANMFRGEVQTKEVLPYPYALTEEQRENIAMFVDPVTSFFTVCHIYYIITCAIYYYWRSASDN